MQDYQQLWLAELAQEQGQLVIDWDSFILNFTNAVFKSSHHQLNYLQQEFIKTKIDPEQTNQVYKNAFLLFAQRYWDIPSNRTQLFKMKINLTPLPHLKILTQAQSQRLTLSFRHGQHQALFEFKEGHLHSVDHKGFEIEEFSVHYKDFLSLGSSPSNDIVVDGCPFVNGRHLKLISVKEEKQKQKKLFGSEQKQERQFDTKWYLRDIAKSNRLAFVMNSPFKYVILKPGMVLNIGMAGENQLFIDKIGYSTSSDVPFGDKDREQMSTILNADRINYLGEIDPGVPLKTIFNLDLREPTPAEIEELYKEGHYYPPISPPQKPDSKNKEAPTITFTITNKRTLKSQTFLAAESAFTVGRAKTCNYRIDDIAIRQKEVVFQFISNFWTVRADSSFTCESLETSPPSVMLPSRGSIQKCRNSTRVRLMAGAPYVLRTRGFQVVLQLFEAEEDSDF